MKKFIYYAAVLLFVFSVSPSVAAAQATGTYNTSNWPYWDDPSVPASISQQWAQGYRQPSDLQQKINALSATADASIFMPVLFGVAVKDISPNFGRWSTITNRAHAGEDIMATKGTPIVSPTAAVVTLVTTDLSSSEGNGVYTANPGGEKFVYYHLDRIGEGVVPGLVLAPGSLIGYVGNTGTSASGGAAHLHFEIHDSAGVATDPFPRLTSEFTPSQKISFLTTILAQTSDPVSLSQFLVTNFRSTFTSDIAANISLPAPIVNALSSGTQQPSSSSLTNNQIQSIIDLLQSFGADAATIANVRIALAGGTPNLTPSGISGIPAGFSFTRNLYVGSTGSDVTYLKIILTQQGCFTSNVFNTEVGPLTVAGIKCLQAKYGISTVGAVGPITNAKLNVLLSASR